MSSMIPVTCECGGLSYTKFPESKCDDCGNEFIVLSEKEVVKLMREAFKSFGGLRPPYFAQ